MTDLIFTFLSFRRESINWYWNQFHFFLPYKTNTLITSAWLGRYNSLFSALPNLSLPIVSTYPRSTSVSLDWMMFENWEWKKENKNVVWIKKQLKNKTYGFGANLELNQNQTKPTKKNMTKKKRDATHEYTNIRGLNSTKA